MNHSVGSYEQSFKSKQLRQNQEQFSMFFSPYVANIIGFFVFIVGDFEHNSGMFLAFP